MGALSLCAALLPHAPLEVLTIASRDLPLACVTGSSLPSAAGPVPKMLPGAAQVATVATSAAAAVLGPSASAVAPVIAAPGGNVTPGGSQPMSGPQLSSMRSSMRGSSPPPAGEAARSGASQAMSGPVLSSMRSSLGGSSGARGDQRGTPGEAAAYPREPAISLRVWGVEHVVSGGLQTVSNHQESRGPNHDRLAVPLIRH